jgi:spermidine synthase
MSNWFEEDLEIAKGKKLKVQYESLIESVQTPFQKIDVYQTMPFGKMLVHDGVIMLTEFDESHYHEMIAHVPLHVHPAPEKILVIGGGDGGTMREVLHHREVATAHLCEIDEQVVQICRKHLPALSTSFDDPRVELFFEDGAKFVEKRENFYDIIIVDSSDPIGPAEVLFQKEFYQNMHRALKTDGIVVTQSESFLYHMHIIQEIAVFSRKIFPIYHYYYTMVPTYPSGVIGFSFCSKQYHPIKDMKEKSIDGLAYYTPDIHKAAFSLPKRFDRSLNL